MLSLNSPMICNDEAFLGMVLVVRQEGGQPEVIYICPENCGSDNKVFGIGAREFAKFAMPNAWLINRRFDYEIDTGNRVSWTGTDSHLRLVSFPCDSRYMRASVSGESRVESFNIVCVFDSTKIDENSTEVFWQAVSTLSRAIIAEERRCSFLSTEVALIRRMKSCRLVNMLGKAFLELRSSLSQSVSLYVNDCIHAHIGIIPFRTAPDPPSMHKSILITVSKDDLQRLLPVDSASVIRRIVDAADPQKTLKDHMIDLGLPLSAIQRVAQHLVYWRRAVIVNPIDMTSTFNVSPNCLDVALRAGNPLSDFRNSFGVEDSSFFATLALISLGENAAQLSELLMVSHAGVASRILEVLSWFLQRGLIFQQTAFYYYTNNFIDKNPILAKQQASQIPMNFARGIPQVVRKRFSQQEMRAIYSKLGCDALK